MTFTDEKTIQNEQAVGGRPPQYAPPHVTLTFDLLTFVPILVFLGLSVLDLGPIYATDRCQTDVRQRLQTASLLNAPAYGAGHNKLQGN